MPLGIHSESEYVCFLVAPASNEHSLQALSDVRIIIAKLYTTLNVDQHQIGEDARLQEQLEQLKSEMEPYETVKY